MKFSVNILLKIVILVTIVIPPDTCQKQTSMNETLTDEISTNETSINRRGLLKATQYSIIYVPDKNVAPCAEGQRQDHFGRCRKII